MRVNSYSSKHILIIICIIFLILITGLLIAQHNDTDNEKVYQRWMGNQGAITLYTTVILQICIIYVLFLLSYHIPHIKGYIDSGVVSIKYQIKNETFDIIHNLNILTKKMNTLF
jgi:hypothetical protein